MRRLHLWRRHDQHFLLSPGESAFGEEQKKRATDRAGGDDRGAGSCFFVSRFALQEPRDAGVSGGTVRLLEGAALVLPGVWRHESGEIPSGGASDRLAAGKPYPALFDRAYSPCLGGAGAQCCLAALPRTRKPAGTATGACETQPHLVADHVPMGDVGHPCRGSRILRTQESRASAFEMGLSWRSRAVLVMKKNLESATKHLRGNYSQQFSFDNIGAESGVLLFKCVYDIQAILKLMT